MSDPLPQSLAGRSESDTNHGPGGRSRPPGRFVSESPGRAAELFGGQRAPVG
jgi:hypothetical protein